LKIVNKKKINYKLIQHVFLQIIINKIKDVLNLEKEFMYYVMDMDQMGNKLPNLYVIKYMVIM